jgi:multidrug resistance efflux pump
MLRLSNHNIDQYVKADNLYSLRAIHSPRAGYILAQWFIALGLVMVILMFIPWQQNVRGIGKVTALNPANRPQTVQSVIGGQIQKWHVREGDYVSKGDTIVTIGEVKDKYFDPSLLARIEEQIDAKRSSIQSKQRKIAALERQIVAQKNELSQKTAQAVAKLDAEKVKLENMQSQYDRNKRLFDAGNIPLTKFQEIEYKFRGSNADYENAKIEIHRLKAEYADKISKSESELGSTNAEIFEAEAEISKLRNEFTNITVRTSQYQLLAPQNGYVVKAIKTGIGETIKEGEAVCSVMPRSTDNAVELYVKAMDVPLISKGRKVRIEFDGWPALQVSGWPSVSVGTFGGAVEVIDYVSSRPGEFRILVIPDKSDEAWPDQLRVGSGIKGWVMLDNVPIWYEVWRQLNGFPPSLYNEPLEDAINEKKAADNEEDEK